MMPRTFQIALPWPPSVNHYWRIAPHGGMYVSTAGVAFRRRVAERVAEARAFLRLPALPLPGRLTMVIDASAPNRAKCDLDNLLKATQDALVHAKVLEDDSQIDDLRVMRDDPIKGGRLLISLTEIEAMHRRAA